jgi:hypothetical protein
MQRAASTNRLKFFSLLGGSLAVLALAIAWIVQALEKLPAEAWSLRPERLYIAAALLLVPINYTLEVLKWHRLMGWGDWRIRTREVLFGVSWSLVGPLRMGAALGRIAAAPSAVRNQAVRAFASSSIAQGIATVLAASTALCFIDLDATAAAASAAPVIAWATALGLTGLYLGWKPRFLGRIAHIRHLKHWGESRQISFDLRLFVLGLSALRYLVFLSQFILLLEAFHHAGIARLQGFERIVDNMISASLTWGIASVIPSPILADLGVREAISLEVFTMSEVGDPVSVVMAGLALWAMNLMLPALVGASWQALYRRQK